MSEHRWKFIRAGGVDQVVIRSGADIVRLDELDQKLWVALACPTRGVEFDERTLDLIDTDGDGRIRPPELIAVSHWVRDRFADPNELLAGGDRVALASISDRTEAGRELAAEAARMLDLLGKPGAGSIGLDDVSDRNRLFAAMRFNGDGIVPPDGADDERMARLVELVVATHGGVVDRNGKPGVDSALAEAFFADAEALDAWRRRAEGDSATLPLGERTFAAAAALQAVRAKVHDYFARCRLAEYDADAIEPLAPSADDYRRLGAEEIDAHAPAVARLPLATVAPRRALPLADALNPAWAEAVEALRVQAAEPLLGRPLDALSGDDWSVLCRALVPCGEWLAEKPPTKLGEVDPGELRALLASGAKQQLASLIEQDDAARVVEARITDLEKLVRMQRDLVHLLNNFVSFAEFYARRGGIFEAGTLYLDARSCDLTVRVDDVARHAVLAGLAKAYLAYCDCTRAGRKMTIVAAFTAGDVDFLLVGRNGVFYDRRGEDWDATITKVIENPISIRQAFLSPYKKFLRAIEEQVAKRAAASDQKATDVIAPLVPPPSAADKGAKPEPPKPPARPRIDVGTVAALGVALGSISAVLVGVFAKFVELGWWIPVALVGILAAISGPSMVIAWLKLRQRSLGPLLDAGGWAINGRMKNNVPLGASLSAIAQLPPGADRQLRDPYPTSHTGRNTTLLLLLLALAVYFAWRVGALRGLPSLLP